MKSKPKWNLLKCELIFVYSCCLECYFINLLIRCYIGIIYIHRQYVYTFCTAEYDRKRKLEIAIGSPSKHSNLFEYSFYIIKWKSNQIMTMCMSILCVYGVQRRKPHVYRIRDLQTFIFQFRKLHTKNSFNAADRKTWLGMMSFHKQGKILWNEREEKNPSSCIQCC